MLYREPRPLRQVWTLLKDQVSYGLLWPPVRYLAEDDLEFSILLPQPSRCWVTDMSHCAWFYEVLGIKPRVSCSLGINPTAELHL